MNYEIIDYFTGSCGGLSAIAVVQMSQFVSDHHSEVLTPSREHELEIFPWRKSG